MSSRWWPGLGPHAEPASPHRLHLTDEGLETGDEPVVPCGHADYKRSEHDRGPDDVLDRGESLARGAETTKHRYRTSLVDQARLASMLSMVNPASPSAPARAPSWPARFGSLIVTSTDMSFPPRSFSARAMLGVG